ncbi:YcaO-like family protein [Bradyrhizobium sp. 190]|uniref:YcaO-like family protein n=1 Tax=Bradyrhizobium sp. 190 TaxID=2782658 RepID=UPI001FFBDA91|nr:YcaO-like family protein [Bradyrhizobium sp. 190]MCK1516513.1 YcaO-like family protein [Bradyrhizobium sp. 190]
MRLQHRPPSLPEETIRKAVRLVDEETGVIKILFEAPIASGAPKIFGCGCLRGDYDRLGFPSDNRISGSTSLVRDQAIAAAIGEAIERYSAAFVPYDEITVLSYETLSMRAVAPQSLTLYDADQYCRPGFGYKSVGCDEPIGWVNGYSLTRREWILVPAFAVYQPYQSVVDEAPVIQQITTGLACGNTLEEAILSAICEIVERDAAMLMWLQMRRPPKVNLDGLAEGLVSDACSRFGDLRRHITVLDVTTDLGIPAYVSVWDGPIDKERGAIFTSSANLVPGRAVVGALTELAQSLMWAAGLIDGGTHVPDPRTEKFSRIEEHVLWPLRPSARPAFEFALSSDKLVDLDNHACAGPNDVLTAIQTCVDRLSAQGHEVIVVDVTSPDIRECGFHVVRAIVPGCQPLFFGTGMHRLSVRAKCNPYPDRAADSLNLHPHPFP